MKIGDEIFIHGFVDEIRKDTVIVKNEGGYFGTIEDEIIDSKGVITYVFNNNVVAEVVDKVLEIVDELNDTKKLVAETEPGSYLHKTLAKKIKDAVSKLKRWQDDGYLE